MLKNWILAAALAALPFAAAAKTETAAGERQEWQSNIDAKTKALSSLPPQEKAIGRKVFIAMMNIRAAYTRAELPFLRYEIGLKDGNTINYSFTYNDELEKASQELDKDVGQKLTGKERLDMMMAYFDKMTSANSCLGRAKESAVMLRALGITHITLRIVDDNKKVLAETPRHPIPDCAIP